MIGKAISHYKIIEKLGGGGMGVVYKAEDIKLNRTVALKFLPTSFSLDDEFKQRFTIEAQAASSFDHPNICTIHEISETDDGQLFIAMAYYDGETLKKKIEKGPLNLEEAIDITIQTAEGLKLIAEKKKLILTTRIPDTLPEVLGDRAEVTRVVSNLIDNAIKIIREPVYEPYGTVAVFEDLYGNLWDLIEPKTLDS